MEPVATVAPPQPSAVIAAKPRRLAGILAVGGLLALIAGILGQFNVLDHDALHEMALFRAALQEGWIPKQELFAYTPTVYPCVHHEWGTGMVLYGVCMTWGAAGLLGLKYLLITAVVSVSLLCARRRGASWLVLGLSTLAASGMIVAGCSPVRAQLFTLLFMAVLLLLLDLDRKGARWWVGPWLAAYVLWVNLHGGFVVGLGLVGLHWIEQFLRTRRVQWHLLLCAAAMTALTLINPYGLDYVRYLWRALPMSRPLISEWRPLWSNPLLLAEFFAPVVTAAYALWRLGWRKPEGILIVLISAYLALRHARHISLFGVAWLCYVPGWLEAAQLGAVASRVWSHRRRLIAVLLLVAGSCKLGATVYCQPWLLRIPTNRANEADQLIYPAGAVDYLREQQFHGNVMTPFDASSYVMWHLYPNVKVGMDSRYEVAYQPGVMEGVRAFYNGQPSWRETLAEYPTDLVLVPRWKDLSKLLAEQSPWTRVYRDDGYELYARPGLSLPATDRTGQALVGRFP